MAKTIKYKDGYEFWLDLASQFCDQEAIVVAERYLECPVEYDNEEELQFRRELRAAMQRGRKQ